MAERPLVGAVFERKSTASGGTLPTFASSTKSGFPLAQHRLKSSNVSHSHAHQSKSLRNSHILVAEHLFLSGLPPPALSTSSTRPSSRDDRKLRFAELSKDSSPEEEGTPEYIRRRFFPDAPVHDPTVAWMESNPSSEASSSSVRFDFTGAIISPSLVSTLPTHLGLHHHSDGTHAGYTLDDIFLLSRSSVPAQRVSMLGILTRIAGKLGREQGKLEVHMNALAGQKDELRKRILAAGVEAMTERGGVGVRAVEAIWECIVGWDECILEIEGVELKAGNASGSDAISSLPLDFFLPQLAALLAQMTLPAESQQQLLAIIRRLAQHSNDIASAIATTPNLVSTVVQTFLLTPIPSTETAAQPDPSALRLLITIALSSRNNALALVQFADSLLRFITMLPPTSPYPTPLAVVLLTYTLRFYTTLASYGFYSHIATTAAAPLAQLHAYVATTLATGQSSALAVAWVSLVEAWVVCATDPHKTSPNHDILWSQVVGWGWNEDMLLWRESLTTGRQQWGMWAALWQAQAAFLEGSRVNGLKGGEEERRVAVEDLKPRFESGSEKDVVIGALKYVQHELCELRSDASSGSPGRLRDTSLPAQTVAAAIRLWLACIPLPSDVPLDLPPFSLPFPLISETCAQLVKHPLWFTIYADKVPPHVHVFYRPLTTLLSAYLGLSRMLPGISDELWMAQAFSILGRFIPGDEDHALRIFEQVAQMLDAKWMAMRGWQVPPKVWEKDGLAVIKPFLAHAIRPMGSFTGPLWPSPQSISLSTTQTLPSGANLRAERSLDSGLPLDKDWTLSPLDHLLRSGQSSLLQSLPSSWDANEVEVVRASLLFTKIFQDILRPFSSLLAEFMLTREEVVFGCMKVFMLEHGQHQDGAVEVFRDGIVGQLMNDLLAPFTIAAATSPSSSPAPLSPRDDLERVASRFLGASTPFYQYYTDFVALYDSVSFSHPLFACLLLPPTSMRYPPDYRKHLWNDFSHILRSIRTPLDQIVANGIEEYIWPVEDDPQIIRAYLRSLVQNQLAEFIRLVAVHHIACNIWPDLRQDVALADERSRKLLLAVVEMGNFDAVREVVTYRQQRGGNVILPPECFQSDGEWRKSRLECVKTWGDLSLAERLAGLLSNWM
jgi:hypothetical protein